MAPLNLQADQAALLKAYRIHTLEPQAWEDIEHDLDENGIVAGVANPIAREAEEDALGIGRGRGVDLGKLDLETRASILLTSKSFDPKSYLMHVYPSASYSDLASAIPRLQASIDSRSEAIRILVEENFDRFVAVKSSTSSIGESITSSFSQETDYKTKDLTAALKQASSKANQVFIPILEASSSATKLRSTLAVFSRSKYLFNLPSVLNEAIDAGKYDLAIRSYKKGRAVRERPPPNIGITESRILDKVWTSVERIIADLRDNLLSRLREPGVPVDEVEKTIEMLLELDGPEDPVWTYFDAQHQRMADRLRAVYERMAERVKLARERAASEVMGEEERAQVLKACVLALDERNGEAVIAKGTGWEVWESNLSLVKQLSEVLVSSLPAFWKIARGWTEGRFKRTSPTASGTRRAPAQIRTMSLELTRLYVSLVSQHFSLSDPNSSPLASSTFHFLPPATNSLTSAQYLEKLLGELNDCVGDVVGLEMGGGGEAGEGLKGLVETARWRYVDVLCDAWHNDSKLFHHLESFTFVPPTSGPTSITASPAYLDRVRQFQQHNASLCFKLASPSLGEKNKLPPAPYVNRIKTAFLDSLYSILDGLVRFASEDGEPVGSANDTESDVDNRILVTVSNLYHLDKELIPRMMSDLEKASHSKLSEDRGTLSDVVQELDKTLFDDFAKSKAAVLTGIIRRGVLGSGMDWATIGRPQEVRSYMYDALIYLVQIHSQVSLMARPLLERTLSSLVMSIAVEALACFKQVTRFGMGGMLAATLEIEFFHQTMLQYVSPEAAATLGEIYTTISQVYQKAPPAGGVGAANLQTELDAVKKTLHDGRKGTSVEFLCFKQKKEKEKEKERWKEKDKERPDKGKEGDRATPTKRREA
ncbi:hypothetical protein DACRYDRAFT_96078 [Dacryopinax primogenitus]|uniref:Exocyst complex component SEC5 n=1 Tax=Dacryopinax primogenitus (strain DJM 731) TaxID=1858805 RepID=M5FUS0_DACPD|nr:uncharacterized protein DACRYDRAFT_96078 [Dacryopinax primogenitus]EJT99244.1 hypothetical protein DACRYDRAFT_96078 [Dacryopinax primogenitus]